MGNWCHFTPINVLIDGQLVSFHPYKCPEMGNWGHFTQINVLIDGQLVSFHPYKCPDRWATGVISPL